MPPVISRLAASSGSRSDSRRPNLATSPSMRSRRVPGVDRAKNECPRSTVWRNSMRRRLFIACQASTAPAWERTISSPEPATATPMNSAATPTSRSTAAPACARSRNARTTSGLATCRPAPATSAATTTANHPRRPRAWTRTRVTYRAKPAPEDRRMPQPMGWRGSPGQRACPSRSCSSRRAARLDCQYRRSVQSTKESHSTRVCSQPDPPATGVHRIASHHD